MCERCKTCKEMSNVFEELHNSYFFLPNTKVANNDEQKPYQPVIGVFLIGLVIKKALELK